MTKDGFSTILKSLAESWENRDYVAASQFFSETIHYTDPTRYCFRNREQLLKFFQDDEGYDQKTEWHTIVFDESQQIGFAEYTYQGTYCYHGIVRITVENGLIAGWREYQHINATPWDEFVLGPAY